MADAGLLQDQRVELIEGEVIEMPPQNNPHFLAIGLLQEALRAAFPPAQYWVRPQGPINLGRKSEPEPDIAVVPGALRDYRDHPTSALLIVEVSDTTLTYDRTRKARLYAQAGIPDYWVLDLVHRQIEVCRSPQQDPAAGTWSYADTRTLTPADTITPLAAPGALIPVADLLP
jgi:Uma2 family endonuclease